MNVNTFTILAILTFFPFTKHLAKSLKPREGVIIECPLIHLFHDARDVILTSRNDVRGMNDDDDDNEMSIFTIKRR